jgi:hypothetical protein
VVVVGGSPEGVYRVEHSDDMRQQFSPLLAHFGAGAGPVEEIDTEFPLEVPHSRAKCGLRDVELFSGAAK